MNAKIKKTLIVLGIGGAALVLAAVIFALTFDINSYKPGIEAAASRASGMDVRVNGKIKLTPSLHAGVSLEDILIRNKDTDVASVKKAVVKLKLLPLLRREVLIQSVGLTNPSFFITRDRKGRFNFERPEKKAAPKEPPAGLFRIEKVSIKEAGLVYLDKKSGRRIEAGECGLAVKNLSTGPGEFLRALSFEGAMSCGWVKAKELRITDVRAGMKAGKGVFEASPFSMKIFGGEGKGSVTGSMSGKIPEYSIDFRIDRFRFEEALGALQQKKYMRGELNLRTRLTVKGKGTDEMVRTADGEVSLRGQDLVLENLDLDRMLEHYEKSQSVDLVDVGAFLFVGPLGTLLTKGYDFGGIYMESLGGKSAINKLVSDWEVRNGVALAEDVAFTTSKNRIALKGRLNFVRDRFEDITVAVLDENACAVFSQTIRGSFKNPQIDKPSVLRSLMGPLISLTEKSFKMFDGGKCEVFYRGSLEQP